MMKVKSMYYFKGIEEFYQFTENIEKNTWRIEKQLLKERVEKYSSLEIFIKMKEKFTANKISIWPLKDEEVITWIDTLSIMRRLFMILFKKGSRVNALNIFMEYPLVYGNYMRTDYLLVYDRLIILLEFGMFNQDEKRSEERYTKKLHESITHAQLLRNIICPSIEVVNYVMIYRPEFDRTTQKDMSENIAYNNQEIMQLASFIYMKIANQDQKSAINQLDYLSSF